MATDLRQRIDTIEKAYEYFLAYAAQGLTRATAAGRDSEARRHLTNGAAALDGLSELFRQAAEELRGDIAPYLGFLEALRRDAAASASAFALALAQPAVSSQLIDNLNASVHVRALLTDLFLLDEALQIPTEE